MCGIIGVVGQLEAAPRILDALKRLEYRGYDSAGLTTLSNGKPESRRAVGKLSELRNLVAADPVRGSIGMGHTRWATHGAATVQNAHPHSAGSVHVIHNGIIENFADLRDALGKKGITCRTETDTEVVAQMAAHALGQGATPLEAVRMTLAQLKGAFALVFLFDNEPNLMIAARHGPPLAIGWGEDEMFVGSDALALSPMTPRISYLDDGDCAVLTRAGAVIYDAEGAEVRRGISTVSVEQALMDKGAHRHFMAKEIHEQPGVLSQLLSRPAPGERPAIASLAEGVDWKNASRAILVGCGTASYAGQIAKYWFEKLAKLPVELDIASEFRYRDHPLTGDEIAIFISQSGETADTLAALRHINGQVRQIAGVINVTESSIGREVDLVLPTLAGPEIGVASTKAFTCQLVTLALAAVTAGRVRGHLDAATEAKLIEELIFVPRLMAKALEQEAKIAEVAQDIAQARDVLYLGRGAMFPMALEGALKLKEISYIHAEGYASGELKHGPIALIDEAVPVVVMAPRDALFEKTLSNMQEVMARGGRIVLVTDAPQAQASCQGVWRVIEMPEFASSFAPIVYAVPAQLLAYHAAVVKGTDVDQPRNLAKSVTVE
ncbi:MAG: glutamine--fructose-6-phosphate transaminase (isomerizing) [Pseudomonadota bacterium]